MTATLRSDRIGRACLGIVIVAWGIQAIVTQSLLLREAVVLMFGSELAWGVVLFAWLGGVAVGGAAGGRLAAGLRRPDTVLVVVLMALSAAACAELWVFRGARGWLGVAPGELLPLSKSALAAMLFVPPSGALVGLAFPLACALSERLKHAETSGAGPLAGVYALESAGSLVGGAAFSFWAVEHLAPIETALVCGAITAGASACLLAFVARRPIGGAGLGAAALAALLLAAFGGESLDRALTLRRWNDLAPDYELLATAESKYQHLAVGRRAEQYTLYCDGQVTADFPDPYSFVPTTHLAMCQHPSPRRVLVLGGGAEGLLAEVLLHPVERVDYLEPDHRLLELIEPYLAETDRRALQDSRVSVHAADARYYVKTQRGCFDLVIARLGEPTSALRARLYTDEFFGELRRAMSPRGVLCMTASATPTALTTAAAEYLASIRATLAAHFSEVVIGWGTPALVLAATEPGLIATEPAELVRRYTSRGVESEFFDPLWFEGATDWLEPDKLRQRAAELDAVEAVEISTDLRPAIYLQRLVLWERMAAGAESGAAGLLERLRALRWWQVVVALVAAGALVFGTCYGRDHLRRQKPPTDRNQWAWSGGLVWSVATTGFVTMALSIVWLFAFQNLYGYVYQRIGWIIAVFMGGLVVGCAWVDRGAKRHGTGNVGPGGQKTWNHRLTQMDTDREDVGSEDPTYGLRTEWGGARRCGMTRYLWRRLVAVDVLLALLALAVPVVLPALGALPGARWALVLVEWAVMLMVALTGVLGGAAFSVAGGLRLADRGRAAEAAGSVVGADHAGACVGALLTGVLLVPVFGTLACAVFLAAVKLTSVVVLVLVGKTKWNHR